MGKFNGLFMQITKMYTDFLGKFIITQFNLFCTAKRFSIKYTTRYTYIIQCYGYIKKCHRISYPTNQKLLFIIICFLFCAIMLFIPCKLYNMHNIYNKKYLKSLYLHSLMYFIEYCVLVFPIFNQIFKDILTYTFFIFKNNLTSSSKFQTRRLKSGGFYLMRLNINHQSKV